jgi:hypothetical protein
VRIALKGFTKEWDVFMKCVVGRENFPSWERLWNDFTQEEIQEGSQSRDQEKERVVQMRRMFLLWEREKTRRRT